MLRRCFSSIFISPLSELQCHVYIYWVWLILGKLALKRASIRVTYLTFPLQSSKQEANCTRTLGEREMELDIHLLWVHAPDRSCFGTALFYLRYILNQRKYWSQLLLNMPCQNMIPVARQGASRVSFSRNFSSARAQRIACLGYQDGERFALSHIQWFLTAFASHHV